MNFVQASSECYLNKHLFMKNHSNIICRVFNILVCVFIFMRSLIIKHFALNNTTRSILLALTTWTRQQEIKIFIKHFKMHITQNHN